jgi:hypothetical protein
VKLVRGSRAFATYFAAVVVAVSLFGVGMYALRTIDRSPATAGPAPAEGRIESLVGYSPGRMHALVARRNSLVRACMARHSLSWSPVPADPQYRLSPHGLFGVDSPSAVDEYLRARGYGVVERVSVIRDAYAQFEAAGGARGGPQPGARKTGRSSGRSAKLTRNCLTHAASRTGVVDLVSGGALGRAYAAALSRMHRDPVYDRFEQQVLTCMRQHGEKLASLDTAADPYLKRLVDLVGGTYQKDAEGRLTYEVGGAGAHPFRTSDLAELRSAEMRRAGVEYRCRRQHEGQVIRIWAGYSEPVARRYSQQISTLHSAMTEKG